MDRDARASAIRRVTLTFPADSPWFHGHFPGTPVLPAVAQLALAHQEVQSALASPQTIRLIRGFRFRSLILPDEPLELELSRTDERSVDVRMQRDGNELTRGMMHVAALDSHAEPAEVGFGALPAEHDGLNLPQVGPARLVRRLESHDETVTRCVVGAPIDSPFVTDALGGPTVPALLAIEMVAQCAACGERCAPRDEEGDFAGSGYLVRVAEAHFEVDRLRAGEEFRAQVELVEVAGHLRVWSAALRSPRAKIATARFSTYRT